MTESDPHAQQWGMYAHLSALTGFLVPFGNIIGPLLVWLINKDVPFVVAQSKEALNFQIMVLVAVTVCMVFIASVGGLPLLLVGIATVALTVIAAIKAKGGAAFRYPLVLRLVR